VKAALFYHPIAIICGSSAAAGDTFTNVVQLAFRAYGVNYTA
jgi:hypothetical protein